MKSRRFNIHPRSKRDESLPYTYEARVDVLSGRGRDPLHDHFFSDTLCGLIDCLDAQNLRPEFAQVYGIYRGRRIRLDTVIVTDTRGHWLRRPELCRVLEAHFEHTHEACYKGHVAQGHCAFEDRSREGVGPVW